MSDEGNYYYTAGHKEKQMKTVSAQYTVPVGFQLPPLDHWQSHCSFIEEVICKVPGSLRIHPALWSKDDVINWLRWAEEEYSLQRTDDSKFVLNGRALCILTKDDFKARSQSSGDVLYELLQCIKNHRQGLTTNPFLSHSTRKGDHLQPQTFISTKSTNCPRKTLQPASTDVNNHPDAPLNLSQQLYKTQQESAKPGVCVDGKIKDCRLLRDYLYQLLGDQRYEAYIKWEDKELKIFRVMDPNKLAALWGKHKNRPNMTYEKMSRALRQYYKINVLKKESGQRLTFRFLISPKERLTSEKLLQLECDTYDSNMDIIAISP
ncbi:transcription factor ETV7-like [Pseudophryne corroboree]|uniref:transcription factor ETV7-like n=1 Tax=Pseudophryne corroboree TaxID=495146 RepID=UPI0030814E32